MSWSKTPKDDASVDDTEPNWRSCHHKAKLCEIPSSGGNAMNDNKSSFDATKFDYVLDETDHDGLNSIEIKHYHQ